MRAMRLILMAALLAAAVGTTFGRDDHSKVPGLVFDVRRVMQDLAETNDLAKGEWNLIHTHRAQRLQLYAFIDERGRVARYAIEMQGNRIPYDTFSAGGQHPFHGQYFVTADLNNDGVDDVWYSVPRSFRVK